MLKSKLQKKLLAGRLLGKGAISMAKNSLSDTGRLTVLPADNHYFLSTVQQVIGTHESYDSRIICFCFRFGEKISGDFSLSAFGRNNIVSASIHAAVNIACDTNIDLLWSSDGVQQVVGSRGTVSTCLSFGDCVNYQSNLDGRLVDISSELRNVCVYRNSVRFVQMYADIPHCLPNSRYHPVSGGIALGVCAPVQTAQAYSRDAERYITTMEGNLIGTKNAKCRLEFVFELPSIPNVLEAQNFFEVKQLRKLLETRPMVVPFSYECLLCVRQIGMFAVKELRDIHDNFKNTGNVAAIWRGYQLELLLEKLIWGRPLCWRSKIFSINLGPGTLYPSRSSTDSLGFLALEPSTCCMSTDDDIPNTAIWTKSECMGKLIQRSVGFHDHIDSSPIVLGRRLIYVLLKDLFEMGKVICRFSEFFAALKSETSILQVVSIITLKRLATILSERRRTPQNVAYDRLCEMLTEKGKILQVYTEAGIKELGLKKFPAIETIDNNRHSVLKWTKARKFWKIVETSELDCNSKCPVVLSDTVKSELERRGLIYSSRIKKAPIYLPWISTCWRKLEAVELSEVERLVVLTFVSCVAFMTEGWYIDFYSLARLVQDLPINQHKLKELEILSKLLLPGCNKVKVFRLHQTIPHNIGTEKKDKSAEPSKRIEERKDNADAEVDELERDARDVNKISEEEVSIENLDICPREITCKPANERGRAKWSVAEMDILEQLKNNRGNQSVKDVYKEYQLACRNEAIAFRTFYSFKNRFFLK